MSEQDDYREILESLETLDAVIECLQEGIEECSSGVHDWDVFWKSDVWCIFRCSRCGAYRLMDAAYINSVFAELEPTDMEEPTDE